MYVHRLEDGRIPKNLLNGELEFESRPVGTPKLRLRDALTSKGNHVRRSKRGK